MSPAGLEQVAAGEAFVGRNYQQSPRAARCYVVGAAIDAIVKLSANPNGRDLAVAITSALSALHAARTLAERDLEANVDTAARVGAA